MVIGLMIIGSIMNEEQRSFRIQLELVFALHVAPTADSKRVRWEGPDNAAI